jgi:pSer/pThr/pTyr-binding forkhead associated (FHA) protein
MQLSLTGDDMNAAKQADDLAKHELFLHAGATTIGRSSSNSVTLNGGGVSYNHAIIITLNKTAYIHDLGSLGGTIVNGTPIKSLILRLGDVITIGNHEIVITGFSN